MGLPLDKRGRQSRRAQRGLLKASLCLFAITGAVGCVQYHPAALSPVQNADGLESRGLDTRGLETFIEANRHGQPVPWPLPAWDLPALTLAALYYHPDLDVARARWGVAQAGIITAGGRPNPTLSLPTAYVTNTSQPSPWILGFNLDIPLETFGKRGYRIAQARQLSDAARFNVAAVGWQVVGRVRARSLDLAVAEQRLGLTASQGAAEQELVQLLERRLSVGEASQLDVTRERVALDRIRLSARDAERQVAEARARLATAIGVPAGAVDGVDLAVGSLLEPGPRPDSLSARELRRAALLGRADVRASLAEYAAAQSALQLEIARQYPDFHLGPGYTFSLGENHYALLLSLVLPILNRNRGPIAEAEARRSEVAARFTALQSQIIGEVDRALAGYRTASRAVAAADSLLETEGRRQRQTQAAFQAGEADRLALVSANLEVASTQVSRLDAVALQHQALGSLEDAIQRPLLVPSEAAPAIPETNPRGEREGEP